MDRVEQGDNVLHLQLSPIKILIQTQPHHEARLLITDY